MNNIIDFISRVKESYSKLKTSKHLFFRGHSNIDYELTPSILRKGYNEREILLDFKQYAPVHNINYDYFLERDRMLADMQHYGIPTRLLDWTIAPLNALFFSCSESPDKDGEVLILNPWGYWANIVRDKKPEEIHQIHIISRALLSGGWGFEKIQKYVTDKFGYDGLLEEDIEKPFAYIANYTNSRILHQRGCFTIHGTDNRAFNQNNEFDMYMDSIVINKDIKKTLLDELNMLYINDYSIYPDFEGMSKMIKIRKSLFNK